MEHDTETEAPKLTPRMILDVAHDRRNKPYIQVTVVGEGMGYIPLGRLAHIFENNNRFVELGIECERVGERIDTFAFYPRSREGVVALCNALQHVVVDGVALSALDKHGKPMDINAISDNFCAGQIAGALTVHQFNHRA